MPLALVLLRRPAWIMLLLSVAFGSATRAEWIHARTEHFEMFSSASEKESRRVLVALEQFRASFLATFPLRRTDEPRTTVVLFGRTREFRPYYPLYNGKPKEVGGYFVPGTGEVTIALTSETAETDPTEIIYHEYVHFLLHTRGLRVPLWLNEGLAELYSTFRVVGDRVEFGSAKEAHVGVLSRAAFIPLRRLFAVTHESPDYNEKQRTGMFYAQSWALTHYLICGADRNNRAKLTRYLEILATGNVDPERSFREAFGKEYREMELALRGYLDGGSYYQSSAPLVLPDLDANLAFRPATEAEVEFMLLNLQWWIHSSADAGYRALLLRDKYPDYPRVHEMLGLLADAEGDVPGALEHWRRAAELGCDNPYVYLQLALNKLRPFSLYSHLDTPVPEAVATELRRWLDRAIELSPHNAEVLESLALIEALAPTARIPVIHRLQTAVHHMPQRAKTLLALGVVRWRYGDLKTAAQIVDVVLASRDADMTTRSAANLLRSRLPEENAAESDSAAGRRTDTSWALGILGAPPPTAASGFLDRILAERGSTAPRLVLPESITRWDPDQVAESQQRRIEAVRLLATDGEPAAMHELAIAYITGRGADFSADLASSWLERAAQAGHSVAADLLRRAGGDVIQATQFLRTLATEPHETGLPSLHHELEAKIHELSQTVLRQEVIPVHRPAAFFPDKLAKIGRPGAATIHYNVAPSGVARDAVVVESSDPEFADAAERALRSWQFLPAIRDGIPVRTEVETTFRFLLEPTN